MVLKIGYDTVKLNKVAHDVTQLFHFQASLLAKSWLRS